MENNNETIYIERDSKPGNLTKGFFGRRIEETEANPEGSRVRAQRSGEKDRVKNQILKHDRYKRGKAKRLLADEFKNFIKPRTTQRGLKMLFRNTIILLIPSLLFLIANTHADTLGKIEVAASYIHIDLIESNSTIKEIDMPAVRVEGAYCFGRGVYLKPYGMYGKKSESELITAGTFLGICVPYREYLLISPSIGINYTKLNTKIDLAFGNGIFITADETFEGWASSLGLELTCKIRKDFRFSVSGQYAWSRSETDIKEILKAKSDSSGPAFGMMVEYDFSKCWSVNIGAAYNESYSREKNGIRGRGAKMGLVRWF